MPRRLHRWIAIGLGTWMVVLTAGCSKDDAGRPAGSRGFGPASQRDAGSSGGWGADGGGAASQDAGSTPGNTNVNLGGAQDFGYFRAQLAENRVPRPEHLEAAGFFAEHHTPLPAPSCGERVCLQALLGVMGNLMDGQNCTMLQLGLNSPIVARPDSRPPLNLAMVVDVSGSMNGGNKIGFVKQGLEILIDGLRPEDKLALITYQTTVSVASEMRPIGDSRETLRGIIRAIQANGGTNIHDGLEAGYRELQRHYDSGRQNRIIFLSDGNATAGNTDSRAILDMSAGYNSEGMGITSVGLGTDFNPELMRGIAEQGDGNFYFLENTSAVREVFEEEIAYFTVPVAFDMTLTLTATGAFAYRRAFGSRLWRDTDNGGTLVVPSLFLAHRVSHEDVTPGGMGRRGGGSALLIELMPRVVSDDGSGATRAEIALVEATFREPGTNRIITDRVNVHYPHAPWTTPERGEWDRSNAAVVQKSFVVLNVYSALVEACTSFHAGLGGQGIGVLERVIAAVEDYNEELHDTDMTLDVELMRDLIRVMRANGAGEPPPSSVPENPWPAD